MSNWTDDEIVLVSAIEHYSYCPRQCALIHVEKVFDENVFTLRGRMMHERVDNPTETTEDGVRVERALLIWSDEHGLQGRADAIEFHPDGTIFPIEYKIDTRKSNRHDELQLCAEALCLEEMIGRPVTNGAIYSGTAHRRREVEFTDDLRRRTLAVVAEVRVMMQGASLPEPTDDVRCPNCSLKHVCMPSTANMDVGFDLFHPTVEGVPE